MLPRFRSVCRTFSGEGFAPTCRPCARGVAVAISVCWPPTGCITSWATRRVLCTLLALADPLRTGCLSAAPEFYDISNSCTIAVKSPSLLLPSYSVHMLMPFHSVSSSCLSPASVFVYHVSVIAFAGSCVCAASLHDLSVVLSAPAVALHSSSVVVMISAFRCGSPSHVSFFSHVSVPA